MSVYIVEYYDRHLKRRQLMDIRINREGAVRQLIRLAFSLSLSLALMITMMPLSNVYAATSADYKAEMDEAQGYINQYQAQLEQDQANLDAAEADVSSKEASMKVQEESVKTSLYNLNKQSQGYIDLKIKEAWPTDVAIIKLSDYTWSHLIQKYPDYETNGYKLYQSEAIISQLRQSSNELIQDAINIYDTKYGPDAFEKSVTDAMGYFNELEALDFIDRCNEIRADNEELAKYWVDVMETDVPDETPQLRISPYLMVTSAMNVALCGKYTDHIYGCNLNSYSGSPVGRSGFGQNVAGRISSGGPYDPFSAWWTYENNIKEKNGHNGNIAEPDFNQTGFAVTESNPYTGKPTATQDFEMYPSYSRPCKTYTTEEYRNGLISYCNLKLTIYESRVKAYNIAKANYDIAVTNYNNAVNAYNATNSELKYWQNKYNTAKTNYDNALANENKKYSVSWKDGLTNQVFKTDTVSKGGSVTPPTPPTHDGYKFTGWDRDGYNRVTSNITITALYRANGTSDSRYTITFIDGLDNTVIATKKGWKGSIVVPPRPPKHDGYTFSGWDSLKYSNIQADATITAIYVSNTSNSAAGPAKPSTSKPSAADTSGQKKTASGNANKKRKDAASVERSIVNATSDEGPADASFAPLKLKSTKQTKKSIKLKWNSVSGASKYVIYGNRCSKENKMKNITSVGSGTTSKTIETAAGRNLTKGKYYKFIVVAIDKNNKVLSVSKTAHVATKGGKVGNYKKVTVKKTVLKKAKKLKRGQTLKLKAKAAKTSKKVKKHRKLQYVSSNTRIATVSSKGVIKAKAAGTCYVYVYAQNGVSKKVKVTVK